MNDKSNKNYDALYMWHNIPSFPNLGHETGDQTIAHSILESSASTLGESFESPLSSSIICW